MLGLWLGLGLGRGRVKGRVGLGLGVGLGAGLGASLLSIADLIPVHDPRGSVSGYRFTIHDLFLTVNDP